MNAAQFFGVVILLISDGNSEIGAHVRLFDLCKASDQIKSYYKSDFFSPKKSFFSSFVRNMFRVTISYKYHGYNQYYWFPVNILLLPASMGFLGAKLLCGSIFCPSLTHCILYIYTSISTYNSTMPLCGEHLKKRCRKQLKISNITLNKL